MQLFATRPCMMCDEQLVEKVQYSVGTGSQYRRFCVPVANTSGHFFINEWALSGHFIFNEWALH